MAFDLWRYTYRATRIEQRYELLHPMAQPPPYPEGATYPEPRPPPPLPDGRSPLVTMPAQPPPTDMSELKRTPTTANEMDLTLGGGNEPQLAQERDDYFVKPEEQQQLPYPAEQKGGLVTGF